MKNNSSYSFKTTLWILVLSLFLVVQPPNNNSLSHPILDSSMFFYPTPVLASKSYPNLHFQVGNCVHVRDASTGEIQQIISVEENINLVDCDRDSVLLYCHSESNDKQFCYKRFDLSGSNESFVIQRLDIDGFKRNPQNMAFIDKKPYFFYETGNYAEKNYKFSVQSPEGILWAKTNNENEQWAYGGCFSYNDDMIVAIAVINSQLNFSTQLFDLKTGKMLNSFEGDFGITILPNSPCPLIPMHMQGTPGIFCLYDIRKREIVYKKSIPNWYYTKSTEDAIWLTTIEDKSNQYRYDDSGPIRIIKIGLDGKELENFTIMPTLPNLPVYSFQIATNQVGALLAKHKTILYNFRTNQKLLELDLDLPEIYGSEGKILLATTSELVCVDEETLDCSWKLNVARSGYIREFETDKRIYLINDIYDHKNQCDAVQIKIINKADNSLEPYEFFVSPFSGGEKNIYDSPYGLVFISDNNICSFAVGGVERLGIKGFSGIQSWKALDDPRYIEIKYKYDRTYQLDTKTGSMLLVSTQH